MIYSTLFYQHQKQNIIYRPIYNSLSSLSSLTTDTLLLEILAKQYVTRLYGAFIVAKPLIRNQFHAERSHMIQRGLESEHSDLLYLLCASLAIQL